jgi:dynein heavy chain
MDRVRVEEDRLKEERVKFENDLRRRREVFNIDIDALRRDIDSLEGYESAFMMKDANEQIDQLNLTLEGLVNDLSDINENEEMLGQNQSDYPRLQQAQAKLKPYEDLWRLVRDFKLNYQTWTRETPVFKLNPEEIEKTTKTMIATAGTLQKMFRGLQIERER